jgi:Cysteine-rich domain.
LIAGREKVQEIKDSGATVVSTACVGCFHTLGFTTKAYGVNVTLKTLAEVVAENLE